MEKTYNGWANYETWRVNLEIFDGMDPRVFGFEGLDEYDLSQCLKEYAEELICPMKSAENSLAESYALAFMSTVNWREIAKHMIETYAEEEAA